MNRHQRCVRCGQRKATHEQPSYAATGYMIFEEGGDRLAYCRGFLAPAPWPRRVLGRLLGF